MKKFMLIAMVACMAIPAMAADVSLVPVEGKLQGTIKLTVAAGENVRGLAIVVSVDGGATIDAIGGVSTELNVNMDAAYENPAYAIGEDVDVPADPAGPGTMLLSASSIVICLGKVDTTENQYAILNGAAGTIDVATITVSAACTVTITADTLRGGIAGDAVVAGTIEGGIIPEAGPPPCYDRLTATEQASWAAYLAQSTRPNIATDLESWCWQYQCHGDGGNDSYLPQYPTVNWVIYQTDLTILLDNWKQTPETADPAADYAHDTYLPQYPTVNWAIYQADLTIMLNNWKKQPDALTDCPGYVAP